MKSVRGHKDTSISGHKSTTARGHKTVAIIGSGISGLSAALKLQELAQANKTPIEYTIFEAGPRAGGIIESQTTNGCVLELGADSFITNKPWGIDLVRRLGLEDQIEFTNTQWRRTLIAHGKTLYPLPDGFRLIAPTNISAFLASPVLSYAGKARVLMDLIIPPRTTSTSEESVADFARRRLGNEALERIVQPMIGGIYVGNVQQLSIQATMPWIAALEHEYGSIIKGLVATSAQNNGTGSGVRYGMFVSLKGGLQKLVDTIVSKLPGNAINLNCPVKQVSYINPPESKFWLTLESGITHKFDSVIMAVPAYQASKLLKPLEGSLAQSLSSIDYSSSVILNMVYKRDQIPHQLDGFGFVVPHCERRGILACTFSSTKFPGRTDADTVILRIFMGGSLHPHMIDLADNLLIQLAKNDLAVFLGISAAPSCVTVSKYRDAMPQYVIGHLDRIKRIEEQAEQFPGLALAGNAYHGVGIPDCIHSGETAAEKVYGHTVQLLQTEPIAQKL